MNLFTLILVLVFGLGIGSVLGYFARQSIARKKADTIEVTLQKRIFQVKKNAEEIISKAKEKSAQLIEKTKSDVENQRRELFNAGRLLLKRENVLAEKVSNLESKEKEFHQKVIDLKT